VKGARQRLLSTIAGQLGRPHGLVGRGVAIMLNRGNRRSVAAAVQATEIEPGGVAADIGFGGGVGLSLLLDRVGDDGLVHGIEVSEDMLRRARSRFAAHIEAGRLRLTDGSLTAVPLDDNSVDAAITVNTVYFVPELDAACAELARVLRPRGRVVVGIGAPEAMARLPFTSYGFTLRPVSDVIAALQKAGLDVVEQSRLDDIAIPHHLLVAQRAS
jgi:ubiquinone/menaquinone biosynthesis C-methylase UbiE